MSDIIEIAAQEGPQSAFLESKADIAIFGGGAGGGKSYALLLEILRHFHNSKFTSIIFRRNSTHIRNPGGLWDSSMQLYSPLGGVPKQAYLQWIFPSGATLKMAHLENKDTVYDYQGSQIPLICWDELTHFEESQVTYMMSRLRSTSGVPGYMRMTTNPDNESWVRKLIDWWIDAEGYPIKERSGVLRWFIRRDDNYLWADTKEELMEKYGKDEIPKSLTFIPSLVHDNKVLMEKDPAYLSNLKALSRVERMRLLEGNWNVRPTSGSYFQRDWFEIIDAIPSGYIKIIRYWDRAATKPNESNKDPDWTRGLLLYKYPNNTFVVANLRSAQDTPLKIEQLIKNTASSDGYSTTIFVEQDPGSSGVADAGNYMRLLAGFDIKVARPTLAKEVRARPVSAQCEAGNVKVLRAPWNDEFFNELENFPEGNHDDIVDVFSGAFNESCGNPTLFDVL